MLKIFWQDVSILKITQVCNCVPKKNFTIVKKIFHDLLIKKILQMYSKSSSIMWWSWNSKLLLIMTNVEKCLAML